MDSYYCSTVKSVAHKCRDCTYETLHHGGTVLDVFLSSVKRMEALLSHLYLCLCCICVLLYSDVLRGDLECNVITIKICVELGKYCFCLCCNIYKMCHVGTWVGKLIDGRSAILHKCMYSKYMLFYMSYTFESTHHTCTYIQAHTYAHTRALCTNCYDVIATVALYVLSFFLKHVIVNISPGSTRLICQVFVKQK